jgi:hypothetical protein
MDIEIKSLRRIIIRLSGFTESIKGIYSGIRIFRGVVMNLSKFINIFCLAFLIIMIISCNDVTGTDGSTEIMGEIATDFNTLVLEPDGSIWKLGYSGNADTGSSKPASFILMNNMSNITAIDVYDGMHIASDITGNVWYWGRSYSSNIMSPDIKEPQKISKVFNIKSIKFFGNRVNILTVTGIVWYFDIYQGNPTAFNPAKKYNFNEEIIKISETMVLGKSGSLYEWQSSKQEYGGLLPNLNNITDFDNVFNRRTVILKKDGTVYAWGKNDYGQLGNGTLVNSAIPVQVIGLNDIIAISAKYDFNLALKGDGTVWFWGYAGRDSNNKNFGYSIPFQIENLNNAKLICAGYPCYIMKNDGSCLVFSQNTKTLSSVFFNQ